MSGSVLPDSIQEEHRKRRKDEDDKDDEYHGSGNDYTINSPTIIDV